MPQEIGNSCSDRHLGTITRSSCNCPSTFEEEHSRESLCRAPCLKSRLVHVCEVTTRKQFLGKSIILSSPASKWSCPAGWPNFKILRKRPTTVAKSHTRLRQGGGRPVASQEQASRDTNCCYTLPRRTTSNKLHAPASSGLAVLRNLPRMSLEPSCQGILVTFSATNTILPVSLQPSF